MLNGEKDSHEIDIESFNGLAGPLWSLIEVVQERSLFKSTSRRVRPDKCSDHSFGEALSREQLRGRRGRASNVARAESEAVVGDFLSQAIFIGSDCKDRHRKRYCR